MLTSDCGEWDGAGEMAFLGRLICRPEPRTRLHVGSRAGVTRVLDGEVLPLCTHLYPDGRKVESFTVVAPLPSFPVALCPV